MLPLIADAEPPIEDVSPAEMRLATGVCPFGMMFPERTIMPLFPPIPMKAKVFVAIYGGLELFNGVTGTSSGVAHFAHLGGMLGGWLMLRFWRGQPPFKPRRGSGRGRF